MFRNFDIDEFFKVRARDMSPVNSVLYPETLPPMQVEMERLMWGDFKFNQAAMKTRPTKTGMIIDSFSLVADDYRVNGEGQWLSSWNKKQNTFVDAEIEISDLGQALKQIKLSDGFEQADGHAKMTAIRLD